MNAGFIHRAAPLPVVRKNDENPESGRRDERLPAGEGWVATVFAGGEEEITALVEDTSAGGVGLRLPQILPAAALESRGELIVTIQSPNRQFTRRACLSWFRTVDGEMRLGVAFLDHTRLEPGLHQLDMDAVRIDPRCALKIPGSLAVRRKVLPFYELDGVLQVACADPHDAQALQSVERLANLPVRAWGVAEDALDAAIQRVYGKGRERPQLAAATDSRTGAAESAGAIAQSEEILYAAYLRQASDIHIDPSADSVVIRLRVDGRLEHHARLPVAASHELVSRFKVLAGMDIAEKRAPQDGRFSHRFAGGERRIDVRVATLPTKYGERMTLRLLALQTDSLTLDRLGLHPAHKASLETFLRRSQGMMILTGPTGSGKTTTLYAAVRMLLRERDVNIVTVEDPIEYEIPGVAQCEVDSADKVSFAKALRSILRHDPDVVMIGEIRDKETADVAIKAALTGHLVLGTLHTNSSAATITRLLDMGVAPYLVAATLRLAVAQRLVLRLCRHCRIPRQLTAREALALDRAELAGATVYEPCGCLYCNGRGFAGRVGLYELLSLQSEWARAIAEGEGEARLLERMRGDGVQFLLDDAVEKMLAGEIPIAEVLTVALSW